MKGRLLLLAGTFFAATLAASAQVVIPGSGVVQSASGDTFSITDTGSIISNGRYVPGGGDTSAITQFDGHIWGQDSRTHRWFILDQNVTYWTQQSGPPPGIPSLATFEAPGLTATGIPTPTTAFVPINTLPNVQNSATTTSSSGCVMQSVSSVEANSTHSPTDVPFASSSVWNAGIGSNAQWSQGTDVDASQLHGLNGAVNAGSWGQPIYFGTASDPLVTVTNTDPLYPVPPQQIHIPANAMPAIGTDAHMSFYDATQPGKMWSYFGARFVNGHDVSGGVTTALGGVWDTAGDGLTNTVTPGSDYNYAAGVITDYDVSQSSIDHMVRLAISRDALKSPGSDWMQNIPWPNNHEDYNGPQNYTGSIVAGSTFGIPIGVDLNSLGLSQGGLMLAKALQNYGGLWRDEGGTNQITFYSTPENENNPLIQQMRADMAKIVPVIEVMRNQGPDSVNGGGPSILPLAAAKISGTSMVSVCPTQTQQVTNVSGMKPITSLGTALGE